MRMIVIAVGCAAVAAAAFSAGYLVGNRRAAALAYEELRTISALAYEDCTECSARRTYANHVCSALGRERELSQNPLAVFRQHRGSYERATGSRREKVATAERLLQEWQDKLKNPEPTERYGVPPPVSGSSKKDDAVGGAGCYTADGGREG